MADDDVFKHIDWLREVGLLETVIILGIGLGMDRLEIDGVLEFDYTKQFN